MRKFSDCFGTTEEQKKLMERLIRHGYTEEEIMNEMGRGNARANVIHDMYIEVTRYTYSFI